MTKSAIRGILFEELEKAGLGAQGGDVPAQKLDEAEKLLQENPAIIMTALQNPQVQQMLMSMIMPMIQSALGGMADGGATAGKTPAVTPTSTTTPSTPKAPAGKPATGTV